MLTRCQRLNCYAFDRDESNLCAILNKTYRNDLECPFFKTENKVDGQTLELLEEYRQNRTKNRKK